MLEAKNTVDTTPETEKVSSKKELSPAEKAEKNRKMKEMMKNVELTKQNGQLKKLDDEKAADNLLREMDDAPNKEGNQNVISKLLEKNQKYVEIFREKVEKKEFRLDTMNTLKILREMNKELRNKAKDGDSEELQKIGEKFGEQIGKNVETRKEKIVNVALMLEHKGGTFTNEFNEPTVSKKEWDEIMDAMSS